MIIKSLKIENYRNYKKEEIIFNNGTNILYGDNAQGKTNILESIFLSATTKSHKGSKAKEIIKFEKEEAHIQTILNKKEIEYKINVCIKKNEKKEIAINNEKIKKSSELLGIMNVVLFSPEDLSIIKNGPSERRKFINIELCQLDRMYLYNLNYYNKIVNQRNKSLKDMKKDSDLKNTLIVWDMQLLSYGKKIIEKREEFINELSDILKNIHYNLSGKKENIEIIYKPNVKKENMEKKLKENMERDIYLKQTSVGPHRDDIAFIINKKDVRKFGSQGQQKTVALSLKLAEIELVKNKIDDNPILLLDDVLSELDSKRQNFLLDYLGDIQTIITCTGLDEFVNNRFKMDKVFKVVDGTVKCNN
jgi:DNA replication and repair protein RecF